MRVKFIIILLSLVVFSPLISNNQQLQAQELSTTTLQTNLINPPTVFRIGFLKADVEPLLDQAFFERLKKSLETDKELMAELNQANFSGIAVIPADGFRDMVRRMNHNEFDLVFCSSTVYVQQRGDYTVILQLRRLRDSFDAFGKGKVMQRGALIMSRRIWEKLGSPPDKETIAHFLQQAKIAVVSSYSAPGYIFPLQKIKKDYGVSISGSLIFCDSSEEVVKYVLSGLADAGCCERGAVDDVFRTAKIHADPQKLIKIVFETDPIPTNPVVIRTQYHPQYSILGRAIKKSLRTFFARLPAEMPRVEDSQDEYFSNLREVISSFENFGQ